MKIAFIVQQANAGHSYVSKAFADALKEDHEVFFIATHGVKENYPFWVGENVINIDAPYMNLMTKIGEIEKIIKEKEIDVVFFNEFYDLAFVHGIKKHAKVVTYIDWFTHSWVWDFEKLWDMTISCAEHTYDVFQPQKNARFVPWGVDTEVFKPYKGLHVSVGFHDDKLCKDKNCEVRLDTRSDFFHNAGWGGINGRKGTKEALQAYDMIRKKRDATMFLHTQTPYFEHTTITKIKRWRKKGLEVKLGTSEPLYHKGKVFVAPTKLEGLGLSIPEALSCGLPVITTDAYPMKQFVEDGYNGLLVKTTGSKPRKDGYFFPEHTIDQKDLQEKMEWCLDNPDKVKEMGENARKFIEENHSFENNFKPKVLELMKELWE